MYGKRALLINGQESTCMFSFTKNGLNLNFPLGECGMELSSNENNQIVYTMKIEMMELDDFGSRLVFTHNLHLYLYSHSSYVLDVALNVECRYESTQRVANQGKKHASDQVLTSGNQAHLIGQGSTAWTDSFTVTTFADAAFTTKTDAITAMGRMIYVDVSTNNTFKIDSSGNQVLKDPNQEQRI